MWLKYTAISLVMLSVTPISSVCYLGEALLQKNTQKPLWDTGMMWRTEQDRSEGKEALKVH